MVGWDYQTERAQHQSQVDAKKGFGGRFGVQKDRQDKVNTCIINISHYIHTKTLKIKNRARD